MKSVLHAIVVYLILWLLFRIMGKRSMAELTTFDFILLLVFSEMTQNSLSDDDYSITNSIILIVTMMCMQLLFAMLRFRSRTADRLIDGLPLVLVEHGKPIRKRMAWVHVDEDDIMRTAREKQGLERLEQIKYAVFETSGGISIIPYADGDGAPADGAQKRGGTRPGGG